MPQKYNIFNYEVHVVERVQKLLMQVDAGLQQPFALIPQP